MIRHIYILIVLLFFYSCKKGNIIVDSLINTAHLEHLYEEITLNDSTQIGAVWIYSNAPDYQHVVAGRDWFAR